MSKSSKYWDDRALRRLTSAEKISSTHINKIKKMYNQAYRNIDKEIASVYKNYSKETGLDVDKLKELLTKKETDKVWKSLEKQGLTDYIKDNYKSRISRLEQIQAQIYGKAKLIYLKEELEQSMCYKNVINDSYYKAIYDTQMGTGYNFPFSKIDNNMIENLLNEKWSGKNYSQRVWDNTNTLAKTLSEVLGGALISGQSIEKTTKQIRDRFNVSKGYAERLVRTETNHFNNQADAMAYQEIGVEKYVFVATLDNRTSLMCQDMDNKVFNYKDIEEGYNYPPLHPNCRSKTRGYLGEEVEKLLQRRARNPITGKNEIIDNMSYKEWYKEYVIKDNTYNVKDRLKPYFEQAGVVLEKYRGRDYDSLNDKEVKELERARNRVVRAYKKEIKQYNFYSPDIEREIKGGAYGQWEDKIGLLDLDYLARQKGLEISMSPYSLSAYAFKKGGEITWGHKPLGSYRVSDHWNFRSQGSIHCELTGINEYTEKNLLTKYNGKTYDIIEDYSNYNIKLRH